MPADLDSILKERLPNSDKQEAIDLYYELLSSGHSIGEILGSLGHAQGKPEHGNIRATEHPSAPSECGGRAPEATTRAALACAAAADARCTASPTATVKTERGRTEEPRATESAPLDDPGSDKREPPPEGNLHRPTPNPVGSATLLTATGSETDAPSGNRALLPPGRFPNDAKRIALVALYTAAVAVASITSFAIVSGGRNTEPAIAPIRSDPSSENEAVAIPGSPAGPAETVAEIPKPDGQVMNAKNVPVPEPSQSVESSSAISGPRPGPGPRQRVATEVPATFSGTTVGAGPAAEPRRQAQALALDSHDAAAGAVGLETERSAEISMPIARETEGQQTVRAFYTALERGNGEAAALLVIPEKRAAGPFSAGALSNFYGRLELPFRLTGISDAGDNLYNVTYTYKVRNGRFCNGRSRVKTTSLHNQVLIEEIQSPSRC